MQHFKYVNFVKKCRINYVMLSYSESMDHFLKVPFQKTHIPHLGFTYTNLYTN